MGSEILNRLQTLAADIKTNIGSFLVAAGLNFSSTMGWLESNIPWISASILTLSLAYLNYRTSKLRDAELRKVQLENQRIEKEISGKCDD